MALVITSTAFAPNGSMPIKYTCEDDDVSPALAWSGVPGNAKSLALIVDDPDAPDPKAPKMVYVHWVLYDLPPSSIGLAEGVTAAQLPKGTREGKSDFGKLGYGGPCPPSGTHRYYFKIFALDRELDLPPGTKRSQLDAALKGHVVAQGELMGRYSRKK